MTCGLFSSAKSRSAGGVRRRAHLVDLAITDAGGRGEPAVERESKGRRLDGTSRGRGREGRPGGPGEGGNAATEEALSAQSTSIGAHGARGPQKSCSRGRDSPLEHLAR